MLNLPSILKLAQFLIKNFEDKSIILSFSLAITLLLLIAFFSLYLVMNGYIFIRNTTLISNIRKQYSSIYATVVEIKMYPYYYREIPHCQYRVIVEKPGYRWDSLILDRIPKNLNIGDSVVVYISELNEHRFFVDLGIKATAYLSLDAGGI